MEIHAHLQGLFLIKSEALNKFDATGTSQLMFKGKGRDRMNVFLFLFLFLISKPIKIQIILMKELILIAFHSLTKIPSSKKE